MLPADNRPYLVLPLLVEQPTWGGEYIASYKNLQDPDLRRLKIGQSYELCVLSLLSLSFSTADKQFQQELVEYNKSGHPVLDGCVSFKNLTTLDPLKFFGPTHGKKSPLLIKFTQALGNSFQIHIKKSQAHPHWCPKPESWYYLEDGIVTYGIKKGADLSGYKLVCIGIEKKMNDLSEGIKNKKISFEEAKKESQEYIKKANPWQFVNVHRVKKHSLVDLSPGGIHHSWEENAVTCPLGNVLYEVQVDVTDDDSTIRSFDKGKILQDGTIRKIHIDDYFSYLDTEADHNDIQLAMRKKEGSSLVKTSNYALDTLSISDTELVEETKRSFVHLFVVEGELHLETQNHTIIVGKGYSCFIPYGVGRYSLSSQDEKTSVLKTYIE